LIDHPIFDVEFHVIRQKLLGGLVYDVSEPLSYNICTDEKQRRLIKSEIDIPFQNLFCLDPSEVMFKNGRDDVLYERIFIEIVVSLK
jgi:hypothetical protein